MTEPDNNVKQAAALSNVLSAAQAMKSSLERDSDLPGMICMHGSSGFGKTFAAKYLAIKHRAYHVEPSLSWSLRDYYENILRLMGIVPEKTNGKMEAQIVEQMIKSHRPLILDEAGYLIKRGDRFVEMAKNIYDKSQIPVMLIGEEDLPQGLERHYEKVHNRILHWVEAKACTLKDCRLLAERNLQGVEIADDLLKHIHKEVRGVTRRISTNLYVVRQVATEEKRRSVDLVWWGDRPIQTGEAPVRGGR